MPTGKRAFLQGVAFWGVVLGLCYLGLRYALPCFLPLVLGAVMAAALHPAAAGLCRRLGWRYRPCAVLVAVAALTLLGLMLWGIGGVVVRQGSALLPQIPAFYRETLLPLAEETVRGLHDAAEAKNVTMTVTGENVTVRAARRLLSEILYNLCDNAIKYNVPGGSVTVDVGLCGESAVLTVADTGIGIPPEHQARVFERFYRVDKSHSRQSGGTGLGLSIVKHAVGDLGGGLHLDSTPGQGTTIRVTVPLEPQEE